jgi:hypothetical protein
MSNEARAASELEKLTIRFTEAAKNVGDLDIWILETKSGEPQRVPLDDAIQSIIKNIRKKAGK